MTGSAFQRWLPKYRTGTPVQTSFSMFVLSTTARLKHWMQRASCCRRTRASVPSKILRLALNLGHQRAIAVGLCAVADRTQFDAVLVMHSDGEDRPADIAALLEASRQHPDHVVLARRAKRSESPAFRFWYLIYKLIFHTLSGQVISFGNYSVVPMSAVQRLVHMPELWNNLAACILRSRLPCTTVPTARGVRYSGRSTMNLVSLVVHGLSVMSVYSDVIFVRALIAAAMVPPRYRLPASPQ